MEQKGKGRVRGRGRRGEGREGERDIERGRERVTENGILRRLVLLDID